MDTEFSDGADGLLLTRLTPPSQPARLLRRPRVEALLASALEYPLGVLVAPAGSGKTTVLAALATNGGWPAAWCRARADDTPGLLLRHLIAAFRPIVALDESRLATLADSNQPLAASTAFVNALANRLDDETLLVIDDYHLIDQQPSLRAVIELLIAAQPSRLHLLLSGRVDPSLASLGTLRLRGELFEAGPATLAFSAHEARLLLTRSGQAIPSDLAELVAVARGWPIAIHAAVGATNWRAAFGLAEQQPAPLDSYLVDELLAELPAVLRSFLLRSAALPWLDPEALPLLFGPQSPPPNQLAALVGSLQLRRLLDNESLGRPAFPPIMRAFLLRRAASELPDWPALQRRLGEHSAAHGDHERALVHYAAVGDARAVATLVELAPARFAAGQPEQILEWVRQLRPLFGEPPALLELQAAALRHLSLFDRALGAYVAAEHAFATAGDVAGQVRALCGQAEAYLGTAQPAPATALLKRALRLLPRAYPAERAAVLRLQAENWANRGRADVAIVLECAARVEEARGSQSHTALPPSSLPARLLMRSGRLGEAREQLEAQLASAGQGRATATTRPGAHRDPLLLLALIDAMLGSGARALATARRSLGAAKQAGSRLSEAIAQLRMGHAYQLVSPEDPAAAQTCYDEALRLIVQVGAGRSRAEARARAEGHMGLTLLHGHAGDLVRAEAEARAGLQIAAAAGDEWTTACILLALGGAATAIGDPHASGWLGEAQARFARGGDTYGQMMVQLWHALAALRTYDMAQADPQIGALFDLLKARGYADTLVTPSLFGPRDMASMVPLLLRARGLPGHVEIARQLLRQGFPTIAADDRVEAYHPGYTLRVQLLGSFRVWRGSEEILARDWQREKARQLFQLLLTYRGQWLQREQICAWLWPDTDFEAAERQFKVTLNALNAALEPNRPSRVQPFFIRRQGLAYCFAPSWGVWLDVDRFEEYVAGTTTRKLPELARQNARHAVALYKGDYLAESLYDLWTLEERERLLARYLATTVVYAQWCVNDADYEQAVQFSEQVLRRDRCYEEAYQVLMRAHARNNSRSQALRSYTRCVQALHDDLGIDPLQETVVLYEQLRRNEPI